MLVIFLIRYVQSGAGLCRRLVGSFPSVQFVSEPIRKDTIYH